MFDLCCDDNGMLNDLLDDVYYFDMVFISIVLVGFSWMVEDLNLIIGEYGQNVVIFGLYLIEEEGVVFFLVISDVNLNC